MSKLLSVRELKTRFNTRYGTVHAVNGVSYELDTGETLAIVGESGSGKSVSVMSLIRLIPIPPGEIVGGEVVFEGRDLLKLNKKQIRSVRGKEIAIIFQDPMTSLNPVVPVGKQISEVLRLHLQMSKDAARQRAIELLKLVGIPSAEKRCDNYPHEFSGGMLQRAMIAMSLSCHPKLLIADEPTTALDVTIQAQIVKLVKSLSDQMGMAVIWITHDLGVVAGLADRVVVMYAGNIVEEARVKELYSNPRHPYTVGLLNSVPRLDNPAERRLKQIEGLPPSLISPPGRCAFYERCPVHVNRCRLENPPLEDISNSHKIACWVNGLHEIGLSGSQG